MSPLPPLLIRLPARAWRVLGAALAALALLVGASAPAPSQRVRVGVYENSPKIGLDSSGRAQGIFVDVIEAIARAEGWTIDYVPGTWGQGLDRLEAGAIDLMPDVAWSAARAERYAFHKESVLSSWAQVYTRSGSGVRSLPDLDGKRIAVLERSVQQASFDQMVKGFGLQVELLPLPDYAAAFRAVSEGRADAVLTNRFYGIAHARAAGLEDTAVVFDASRLHFAARAGQHAGLLEAIDRRLVELKGDRGSAYYQSLARWTGDVPQTAWPRWLGPAAAAALLTLAGAFAWGATMRRQVSARTREIAQRNDEMLIANRTLRAATTRLDLAAVLEEALAGARLLTDCDGGVLCLHDNATGLLTVGAALQACAATDRAPDGGPLREGTCPAFVAALPRQQGYLVLDSQAAGPMPCANVKDPGVRWNLLFPLELRGQSIGVLCLFSRRERPPPDRVLDLVQELCAPLALAIDNARLYARERQHAHELEQRVAVRTDELARANHELHAAKEAAEAADRIKSAFLATMSHELRTPLNSIIGFTGVMLQGLAGALNDEQAKQMNMVRDSARHLLALINDVLDISKIEAGQLEVAQQPYDLRGSIDKVVGIARPLARAKGLELRVDVDARIGAAVGDARRAEQVLLNLLSNAVKFTERGTVTLLAQCRSDWRRAPDAAAGAAVSIAVVDTGMGIKDEDIAMLFKPFRQIDSALSRQHEGTGLGLAICRRLADLMGGTIEATSRWQHGSRFTLTLPLDPGGR